MKPQINIAELLEDCPKGMELYSPLCGKCVFDRVNFGTIICKKQNTQEITFTSKGYYMLPVFDDCECMIFPSKDRRDWSKFVPPYKFKDGDIYYIKDVFGQEWVSIIKKCENDKLYTYVDIGISNNTFYYEASEGTCYCKDIIEHRLATEEEKLKLFQAIKDNGYKWNAETKTLEKLSVPSTPEKFYIRIGDIPSEEKSSIYRGDVVVGCEDGVSVYNCVETDGLYRIVMPFPLKEGQGMTYECLIQEITQCRYEIENPRNVYLVSGIEVGKGNDNEPVIKNVKILKDLTEQFNTKNDNTEETKTLKKLPKFKVGDKIRHKTNNEDIIYEISAVYDDFYGLVDYAFMLNMKYQDDYELVQNKFDITTLKPFKSEVLVRNYKSDYWKPAIFGFTEKDKNSPVYVEGGNFYYKCIPYEGNEYLLGKTEDCDDFYKTW